MKPNEEEITRWVDGELDPAQSRALEADPALCEERDENQRLGEMLREHYPAARDVTGPDLFMHQLARRLDGVERDVRTKEEESPKVPALGRSVSQRGAWFVAAAAALVALLAVVGLPRGQAPAVAGEGVLLSSYTPDPEVVVDARYDEEADAVVFLFEGLEPVHDAEEIAALLRQDSGKMGKVGEREAHADQPADRKGGG